VPAAEPEMGSLAIPPERPGRLGSMGASCPFDKPGADTYNALKYSPKPTPWELAEWLRAVSPSGLRLYPAEPRGG